MKKKMIFKFPWLFETWMLWGKDRAAFPTIFTIGALSLICFSGCTNYYKISNNSNRPTQEIDAASRYPYVVNSQPVTQRVTFQGSEVTLDKSERDRVDEFLKNFLRRGGGILEIAVPTQLDDTETQARLHALRQYIISRGTRAEEIHASQISSDQGNGDTITLRYNKFAVEPINCDRRNAVPVTYNPSNMQHPDFGCSSRANIAAMVANPADLEQPQARQPADAARRNRVTTTYRAGEPTEAEHGARESGSTIRDLGGGDN